MSCQSNLYIIGREKNINNLCFNKVLTINNSKIIILNVD